VVDCTGAECTVDLGIQFCERCGRDRDTLVGARAAFRNCPSCGAACCEDCWNLVDGACLVCTPFRLVDLPARPRVVVAAELAATPIPDAEAADLYANLRGGEATDGGWESSWNTGRPRPREIVALGATPTVAPDAWRAVLAETAPPPPRRGTRRAGRLGLAAATAWVVVAGLAVVALGASPRGGGPVAGDVTAPATASPTAAPTPAPPTATPRVTPATPRPQPAPVYVQPRPAPRVTPRPAPPVIVAPPPPPPAG
jgi:hypothetical protein